MNRNRARLSELLITVGGCGLVFGLLAGLNELVSGLPVASTMVGVVDDWSHHHVAYTNPGTAEAALAQGRLEQWYKTVNNPRYLMQELRRDPLRRELAAAPDFAARAALLRERMGVPDEFARSRRHPEVILNNDWNVDVGPIGVGSGNYPAKFSFNGGVSCSDIAVFNTSEPGSSAVATVMGINNLYSSCTGSPSVAFAYNTTTGDTVATSVIFSFYGDQVAFVSANSSHAYLNVLRFQTATGNGTAYASPVTLAPSASASAFTTCKAGTGACLYRVEFANAATDTNSSPYYDYDFTDKLWVGDDTGNVHEFTGVFMGSVAESGNPWGSTGATTRLTSPVFDGNTYVYVGAANGLVYGFTASSGALNATSASVSGGLGLVDAPVLDVAANKLYETVPYDSSNDAGISQLPTPGLGAINEVYFGGGSATVPAYNGTFDNTHYVSGGTTGYITTCNWYSPSLYFNPIAISGFPTGTTGTTRKLYSSVTGDVYEEVASAVVACSPQIEILNGTSDYVYLSVASYAYPTVTGCTTGTTAACVYAFVVGNATSYTWTTAKAPDAGFSIPQNTGAASSTSGMVVDNTGSTGGSNIYFTTNATTNGSPCTNTAHGCAIQVAQSGL